MVVQHAYGSTTELSVETPTVSQQVTMCSAVLVTLIAIQQAVGCQNGPLRRELFDGSPIVS